MALHTTWAADGHELNRTAALAAKVGHETDREVEQQHHSGRHTLQQQSELGCSEGVVTAHTAHVGPALANNQIS